LYIGSIYECGEKVCLIDQPDLNIFCLGYGGSRPGSHMVFALRLLVTTKIFEYIKGPIEVALDNRKTYNIIFVVLLLIILPLSSSGSFKHLNDASAQKATINVKNKI
jgi:hypothetical protein